MFGEFIANAGQLYQAMKQRCPERFVDVRFPARCWAFLIPIERNDGASWELSVAVPPDQHGFVETALIKNGEMTTAEKWGYDQLRYNFGTGRSTDKGTVDALVKEIDRLESADPGIPVVEMDSESEPESESEYDSNPEGLPEFESESEYEANIQMGIDALYRDLQAV